MEVTRRLFVAGSVVPVAATAAGLVDAQPARADTPATATATPNIEALRALPPQTPSGNAPAAAARLQATAAPSAQAQAQARIAVQGFQTAGDGGGGDFVWDPQANDPDDNGVFIKPQAGDAPGRWRRVIADSVNVRWFGAKADGTGDASDAINAALTVAVRLGLPLLLSGTFRVEKSVVLPGQVNIHAAATLIAANGAYNAVPFWSGESSGRSCVVDLAYGRFSTVIGRLAIRAEDPSKPPTALAAISCSKGIYSELLPNPEGRGGSNTTWQSVEVYDLEFGFFTPERGLPVPSQLPQKDVRFARADWQPSAVPRGDGTYAVLTYQPNDYVIAGRDIYVCMSAGTPAAGLPPLAPGPKSASADSSSASADVWEYLTDEPIKGVQRFAPGQTVEANTLITTDTGTYRARRSGTSGSAAPATQGFETDEMPVPAWSAGDAPALMNFRTNGGKIYRLIGAGTGKTEGRGPSHTDERPVADANGWSWAYAGPATSPKWRYIRKISYCAAGTGMVVDHFWTQNVATSWMSSATATDDSFIIHFRAQASRDTAIRINGGNFAAANVYIHGDRGRFASGHDDPGAAAIQNFGVYRVGSTYIDGEWARGMLLGQRSETDTTFKADGGFKTATGVAIEAHPAASQLVARIRSSVVNAGQPMRDYAYVDTPGSFADGATLTGPNGKAIVLSSQRTAGSSSVLLIYRLLSGSIQPGDTVTSDNAHGQVARPYANTLSAGLIGIPTVVPGATRQIDVELPDSTSKMIPYRPLGSPFSTEYDTRDRLLAQAPDGSMSYCFRSGLLVRAADSGYFNLGSVSAIADIDPERGVRQLLTIAKPEGQIRLPNSADPATDSLKRGSHLQLEITNAGVAKTLFFTDKTHPAPIFIGGEPNWPASGVVVLNLWVYNGAPWRTVVLGGAPSVHGIPANGLRPTGDLLDMRPSSTSPGYQYVALPGDETAAAANPVWFEWNLPPDWDRGPVRFRYRWARAVGGGRQIVGALQGRLLCDGTGFNSAMGDMVTLPDSGASPETLYVSGESAEVPLAGMEKWHPGATALFRFRRMPSAEGAEGIRDTARLLGIDLLYGRGESRGPHPNADPSGEAVASLAVESRSDENVAL